MCNHERGSVPYRCSKNGIILSKCQHECDSLASCVGFSESFATTCYLFPSSVGCPSGWDFDTGYVAVTSNQLIASEVRHGSNCYIKQGTLLQIDAEYFIYP